MRLVRLRAPGGLENLKLVEEDHPKPRPGELLVRIRAAALNFHDDLVVHGKIPCADGRIPLSDGAGEVLAVGDDVDEFEVASRVRARGAGSKPTHLVVVIDVAALGFQMNHHMKVERAFESSRSKYITYPNYHIVNIETEVYYTIYDAP
jgi:NADPH:quinone reductase-like Zn-dependent oxidoreductase